MAITREERRSKIKYRIRKKVSGSIDRPRLTVFRSNKGIYAQIIDDNAGVTLVSASSIELDNTKKSINISDSKLVGKKLAEKALEQNIKSVTFDRNGYLYHGRIKALAEGAREAGLEF